jgi:hypothetical protein
MSLERTNRRWKLIATDEATESALQFVSWPSDDSTFSPGSKANDEKRTWLDSLIECLALSATAYFPSTWPETTAQIDYLKAAGQPQDLASPDNLTPKKVGICAAAGAFLWRLWN